MSFVIEFWIGWIPMLSQNLFVKSRRHRCLRVIWSIMLAPCVCNWTNWLGMCCFMLPSHFIITSLFRSVFRSTLFEVFLTLYSSIFIKHVLRRRFVHYKSITSFFIFRCLSFGIFFWVWVILFYILDCNWVILDKAFHIAIITLFYKCLVDGQFIVTLSVSFLVQIKAALSIDSRARLWLLLAL
jgi:hypothetical protein